MFNLVASKTTYTPNSYTGDSDEYESEEIVATFDVKQDALQYIKKSRLKHPKTSSWSTDMPFRQSSLLANWSYAEVEEAVEEIPPPHNPK